MSRGQSKTRARKSKGGATAAPTPGRRAGTIGPTGPTTRRTTSNRGKRRRLRTILGAGTVALLAIVIVVAVILDRTKATASAALTNPVDLNPATKTLSVGAAAPNFDLATVDGQHISLSSLKGHPVVLEFFAIWCPHCQNEAATLNQIDSSFASRGERTVAVLANPYGRDYDTSNGTDLRLADRGDLSWFETTFKVHHTTLIDPTFATVNQYGANAYPMIYVIDGSGNVQFAQSGEVPYQSLADVLNRIH
ncbi:MAG: peroxiredoxin family protein [Chloroflexota bacterium]